MQSSSRPTLVKTTIEKGVDAAIGRNREEFEFNLYNTLSATLVAVHTGDASVARPTL